MVYVARYSHDIESDIQRGWSGLGVREGRERHTWSTRFEFAQALLLDEALESSGLELTER